MLPHYAARIEDLGQGNFVKADCSACHHVALRTPEALLRAGLSPTATALDLKDRLFGRLPPCSPSPSDRQASENP